MNKNWVLLKIFYDEGSNMPGARFGAKYISTFFDRYMSIKGRSITKNFKRTYELVSTQNSKRSFLKIVEESVKKCASRGESVFSIGGDHSLTYHIVASLSGVFDNLCFIYFDAHLDVLGGREIRNWNFVRKLGDKKRLTIINVGARHDRIVKECNIKVISAKSIEVSGIKAIGKIINRIIKTSPVYISIDLDVIDPCFAPGVSSPSGCGISPLTLLGLVTSINQRNLIGFDIMEFNPLRDRENRTLFQIQTLLQTILSSYLKVMDITENLDRHA